MLLKTGLPTLGRPRWRGRRLACSRRWVRGCLRGHPSANSGSEAVDGSVDVGGVSPSRLSPFSPVIFSGEQAGYPDGPTTLSFFQWSRQAVPLWHGSARQGGGHTKPGIALLACQRSTGGVGSCKAPRCSLVGQRSIGRLHKVQRCPSDGPVLDRGVAPSPVMPLWGASAGHRGHGMPPTDVMALWSQLL